MVWPFSSGKKNVEEVECTMVAERVQFDKEKKPTESALLTFKGVDGFDVYNCSAPFTLNGVRHIFGRVERNTEWVNSTVKVFKETGKDEFTLAKEFMTFHLEDPFVIKIQGEMLFGGVRVTKNKGRCCDYFCDFFRGDIHELKYFSAGPDRMKDIRLVELADGRIGVFSHHKYGKTCVTGFITINKLDELSKEVIDAAVPIDHTLFGDAWGGVNQPYLLSSGKIGCISHHGYVAKDEIGNPVNVYCITSFVYEPSTNKVYDYKILGTKECFPELKPKVPRLYDCAFVSGIAMREDGRCDLYSGLGDAGEGRMVVDYPFEGHGTIVPSLDF